MAATYEPIATTTVAVATSSITFSSIPSTYTDLRISFTGTATLGGSLATTFNGDTSANYSRTGLFGNGTSAGSYSGTSQTSYLSMSTAFTTTPQSCFLDIFSYAGSTYKTVLSIDAADQNGAGTTRAQVGLWRSTSAITSITLTNTSTVFAIGTTATIWGIKAA